MPEDGAGREGHPFEVVGDDGLKDECVDGATAGREGLAESLVGFFGHVCLGFNCDRSLSYVPDV